MSSIKAQHFYNIVEILFERWTAFKLAVQHMGGRSGANTALEILEYITNYCLGNDNVTASELCTILEEILDEEFDTICEDNSIIEMSAQLEKYTQLFKDQRFDDIDNDLSKLPLSCGPSKDCTKIYENEYSGEDSNTDDVGSTDSSDNEDGVEKMDVTPSLELASASSSKKLTTDEDGWTTVCSARKKK